MVPSTNGTWSEGSQPDCVPGLPGCQQQHRAGTIESRRLARRKPGRRERRRQIHFRGHFHALAADVELCHRAKGGAARAESLRVRLPPNAQSGDDAGAGDHDARRWGGR